VLYFQVPTVFIKSILLVINTPIFQTRHGGHSLGRHPAFPLRGCCAICTRIDAQCIQHASGEVAGSQVNGAVEEGENAGKFGQAVLSKLLSRSKYFIGYLINTG